LIQELLDRSICENAILGRRQVLLNGASVGDIID
jgi:hypothetical protein